MKKIAARNKLALGRETVKNLSELRLRELPRARGGVSAHCSEIGCPPSGGGCFSTDWGCVGH